MKLRWHGVLTALLLAVAPMALAFGDDGKKGQGNSVVPVFKLAGGLPEVATESLFSFSPGESLTLREVINRLSKSAADPNVKAIVLFADDASVGAAQVEELRQAMAKVRRAGKEIYVHADEMSLGGMILLSGASRISIVPTGDLWIIGMNGESPYIRGLLDKLGVKPDYLTCGDYKSAAEMFMREGPSAEAERMQNWLLDSIFESRVNMIAKGRNVDAAKVKDWIDNGPYTAEKAKELGIVDAVEHRQDFEKFVKEKVGGNVTFEKKYGQKKQPTLDLSSPFALLNVWGDLLKESTKKSSSKKPAIGIVHVNGAITLGGDSSSPFADASGATSTAVRKALDKAANDDSIKAVVLRVDSPGGSAVASEIILNATKRVKSKKPFVVSMGDVAGSGGYYVACASDVIFADESTITGSIGVVGGKFATSDLWKKLGITFKQYKRGKNAGILSSAEPFTQEERQKMQAWMNEIYGVFKGHVVAIRGNKLKKPIDELAGGRVYTGKQALELGLVDKIGTLQDAIEYIAGEAKLTDYDVRVVPEQKNFMEQLIEELSGSDKDDKKSLEASTSVKLAPKSVSLIDLAMPEIRHLDPERVKAVVGALRKMQLIHEERVMLMMPEIALPK